MGKFIKGGEATFKIGEDIALIGLRVRLNSSGNLVKAGVGQDWIGTSLQQGVYDSANDSRIAVRLRDDPGTHKMVCSAAVAAQAKVYATSGGKIDDVAADFGEAIGIAQEAGTADLSEIEVLPFSQAAFFATRHVVTAGEDTANVVLITHNFGANPTGAILVQIQSTGNVFRAPAGAITNSDTNTLSIADAGFAVNEIVHVWIAR